MPKFISAVSGKGGAGKTTAVILIAGEYALRGKRVLLIDADGRQNLQEWWKRCEAKDNLPDNIELITAARQTTVQQLLENEASKFDVVLMDSPGQDTVLRDTIIAGSDIVLTPIQPNQDEIKAAGQAAADTADISDKVGREIPHANFVTRITMPAKLLEAYRLIRPFVQNLQEGGYDSYLLQTELMERNCYREIRNGYGTVQMLDLTQSVKKARAEVMSLVRDIEALLAGKKEVAANG
ncbi:ParA family protein [Sinorhizobium medicae]|uniref:ParA family protein n=1 Tax=Sinorhizobium medicae TaxID=110321 RepID=UPI001AAE74E2|nr:ParA family protein [Sinorhizobium medicae]MDW9359440.1 AAA family ATPase [Sinorhizobium meliloti]MBO1965323.1 ParA family protein [Sinorhizobium medicae]MDW9943445.1 AAA family ATPase [Sinorhizobium meliloti]WQO56791.1 ParA family protein [Sinorhizobium medicae]WQP41138.1 ParA family protein [Sinorhizobium medicae]